MKRTWFSKASDLLLGVFGLMVLAVIGYLVAPKRTELYISISPESEVVRARLEPVDIDVLAANQPLMVWKGNYILEVSSETKSRKVELTISEGATYVFVRGAELSVEFDKR